MSMRAMRLNSINCHVRYARSSIETRAQNQWRSWRTGGGPLESGNLLYCAQRGCVRFCTSPPEFRQCLQERVRRSSGLMVFVQRVVQSASASCRTCSTPDSRCLFWRSSTFRLQSQGSRGRSFRSLKIVPAVRDAFTSNKTSFFFEQQTETE